MIKKTKKMLEVEAKVGMPIQNFLRREYIDNKNSLDKISKIILVDHNTVYGWLKKFNIKVRDRREAKIKYTKERLIVCWETWMREYRRQPKLIEWIKDSGYPNIEPIKRYFSSWNNFVKEMGGRLREYSKEDLKKSYKKWMEEHNGKQPLQEEWEEHPNYPSLTPIYKHFGTWGNFVTEMGGETKKRVYSKSKLKKYYKMWLKKHGKQPTVKDFDKEDNYPSVPTIRKYFGSWNNFIKEMKGKLRTYSKEKIIKLYKKWFKKFERQPKSEEWGKNNGYPCYDTIIKYFGTWGNFLNEAGGVRNLRNSGISVYTPRNIGLYQYKTHRKKICDKVLEVVGKKGQPERLLTTDFERARKELGRNNSGILGYYKREFKTEGSRESLNELIKDLYGIEIIKEGQKLIRTKRGLKKYSYSVEEGLKAFFNHIKKCKREGRKHAAIKNFFERYDPKILEPIGNYPLSKYLHNYYKEMKKLEQKVE